MREMVTYKLLPVNTIDTIYRTLTVQELPEIISSEVTGFSSHSCPVIAPLSFQYTVQSYCNLANVVTVTRKALYIQYRLTDDLTTFAMTYNMVTKRCVYQIDLSSSTFIIEKQRFRSLASRMKRGAFVYARS